MINLSKTKRSYVRQAFTFLVILLVAVSLLILANSLGEASFRAGIPPEASSGEESGVAFWRLPDGFFSTVGIFFSAALLLATIFLLSDEEGRRQLSTVLKGRLRVLLILVALIAIGQLFVTPAPEEEEEEVFTEGGERAEIAEVELPELENQEGELIENIDPSPELVNMLAIVFVVGTAVLGYLWWLRRGAAQPPPAWDSVQKQFRRALEELHQDEQPLEEIIRRCYREMTQAVYQQYGVNRRQGMTPREYELTLQKMSLPLGAVRRLTRLFEKVRYGNYEASYRDRMEAFDCLETIVRTFETQNVEAIEIAQKAPIRHDNRGWR